MQIQTYHKGIIGRKIILLAETPSTNDYAKELLSKCEPYSEGTVIMAVHQSKGRGQINSSWVSDPGKNLTFSILLSPAHLNIRRQFFLVIAISLGLRNAVLRLLPGENVQIKWPNDLFVQGKKIAGMLVENVLQGSNWKHSIVGIGLNVNQRIFPSAFQDQVTSMSLLKDLMEPTHDDFDLNHVFSVLCEELDFQYQRFSQKELDLAALKNEYLDALYAFEEKRDFYIDGIAVPGKIIDVLESGRLVVDFDPVIVDFGIKEIQFSKPFSH